MKSEMIRDTRSLAVLGSCDTKSTVVAKIEDHAIKEGEHGQKLVESQRGSKCGDKIGVFDDLE